MAPCCAWSLILFSVHGALLGVAGGRVFAEGGVVAVVLLLLVVILTLIEPLQVVAIFREVDLLASVRRMRSHGVTDFDGVVETEKKLLQMLSRWFAWEASKVVG